MSVDNHGQDEKTAHRSLFQNLTLIFAGLTIFFAIISIITGIRHSTLRSDYLMTLKKSNSQETASIGVMRTALDTAQANLEAANQAAAAEKKNAERLNQKLSATQRELEKVKADLADAAKAIAEYEASIPTNRTPSGDSTNPELPVKTTLPQEAPAATQETPQVSDQPMVAPQPE